MHATATVTLRATHAHIVGDLVVVDGVAIEIQIRRSSEGPGYHASWEWSLLGEPVLRDREGWDDAHPGVEPTADAMWAVLRSADEVVQDAVDDYQDSGAGGDY